MEENPEKLKEKGNEAVKQKKFEEAILHYTFAIKLDPNNYTLYSNRSLAFLKLKQFYFALEDANKTIELQPVWPKGYFRRAEVEFATQHFNEACDSYRKALQLKPDDLSIIECLNRTAKVLLQEKKNDETIPWVGAGIGIVVGVIIVLADCLFTLNPTHPMLMAMVTIVISMVGYAIARSYRYYKKCKKNGLLEPPIDLLKETEDKVQDEETETNNSIKKEHNRYTKSQARQRYKKGKM